MDRQGIWQTTARGWALAALLVVVGVSAGCAQGPGPLRVKGISKSSTIGSDFRQVPRGTTIPPAGFGVDLVRSAADSREGDPETLPAAYLGRVKTSR